MLSALTGYQVIILLLKWEALIGQIKINNHTSVMIHMFSFQPTNTNTIMYESSNLIKQDNLIQETSGGTRICSVEFSCSDILNYHMNRRRIVLLKMQKNKVYENIWSRWTAFPHFPTERRKDDGQIFTAFSSVSRKITAIHEKKKVKSIFPVTNQTDLLQATNSNFFSSKYTLAVL